MAKQDKVAELVGGLIGDAIGWFFCMAMLGGFYALGSALAHFFGGAEHRDTFGLLSAGALVWIYEHRRSDERWQRMLDRQSG